MKKGWRRYVEWEDFAEEATGRPQAPNGGVADLTKILSEAEREDNSRPLLDLSEPLDGVPPMALAVLMLLTHPSRMEAMVGDLEELFAFVTRKVGLPLALAWLWVQVAKEVVSAVFRLVSPVRRLAKMCGFDLDDVVAKILKR